MRRTTYQRLTTGLLLTSAVLMVGAPFAAAYVDLDDADFLLKLAVLPGGFLVGGLIYLCNGVIEYYADLLPNRYRDRSSQRERWQAIFSNDDLTDIRMELEEFAVSHGLRRDDAFQFHPDDRLLTVLGDLYPGQYTPESVESFPRDLVDASKSELDQLIGRNPSLKEYVVTIMEMVKNA